ncbi:17007_t:CDS:2, partial [Gigaspora rosea]
GIECTRPYPRIQEEFEKFKLKVSHIIWQFESTKVEFLHMQVYMQLNTRMTLKSIKELFARLGKGELPKDITGPFEFGKFREIEKHTKTLLRPEEYKNEEYEPIVEGNKLLADGATPLEVFKHNLEKVRYSQNYDGIKKIYEDLQQENKKEIHRFWRPVTIYFYGPGGSRKTGLIQELFSEELYDKPKIQRSESNWWNGYEGQEIVLIDEFYTKIDWDDMINVLNNLCFNVEKKHSRFEPFIAKYVFLTATKPPEEAYNFSQT